MPTPDTEAPPAQGKFVQGLGLMDSTMLVAGSMIGSGVFIVSADIGRQVGSTGWLLMAWLVTGALTISAALSYGELAAHDAARRVVNMFISAKPTPRSGAFSTAGLCSW